MTSKSITLDTWSREHIQTLRSIGNAKSNEIYNPNETKNPPPTTSDSSERDSEMEKYIRRKYEVGAFKAGASSSKVDQGVNSRDRYKQAQTQGPGSRLERERERVEGNRRNPELNNLVFKKETPRERDLPPLPTLSATRTGSSSGAGTGARERPKPVSNTGTGTGSQPPPLKTEAMLINFGGGGLNSTLPLQSQFQPPLQAQAQQIPTFTQNGTGFGAQFDPQQQLPQQQFGLSPNSQGNGTGNGSGNGYFPAQSFQQCPNNPFMQQQQQQPTNWPQQQQQQFLSPSPSPSPYGSYGDSMGTSPGGTNPFLQMNLGQSQSQQQMGQMQFGGLAQGQGQGQGWNGQQGGQGQQWQGQQTQQFQQPLHNQYGQQPQQQQQQQQWTNMGMAGMGMGYAQGH